MAASSEHLISSVEVHRAGDHDLVKVWNRGGLAGTLTVITGDGYFIAERLMGSDAVVTRREGVEVWVREDKESPTSFKEAGTLCSVCKTKQYVTPHGLACKNGHGGAPPL